MDRNMMLIAPAIFALTLSTSVFASEPPVKVNVSHLQPAVAAEVQKHAAMGMTSLTRYLEATRKQHGLSLEDVTRPALPRGHPQAAWPFPRRRDPSPGHAQGVRHHAAQQGLQEAREGLEVIAPVRPGWRAHGTWAGGAA
jgi:hypothetical protein